MDYWFASDLLSEIESPRSGNDDLAQYREDFVDSAVRYARKRVDWQLAGIQERMEIERSRRLAHDAFIDSCNVLARCMKKNGLSSEWRDQLGEDRCELGDFACFIHLILGLRSR